MHADADAADGSVTGGGGRSVARAFDTLVGIGPVLALTLRAEIGDITRFARGAELASYAGLVPRVDASADRYWHGRITREGSPWLRWALVEAAMHAHADARMPSGGGRGSSAVRKGGLKARVALARVLCDDIVAAWPRPVNRAPDVLSTSGCADSPHGVCPRDVEL